jgi:Sulfotransferase domain
MLGFCAQALILIGCVGAIRDAGGVPIITMKVLVCGMHRSGTSAVAHVLARTWERSLLDDPEWAISEADGPISYRQNPERHRDLNSHEIIKCPRAAEFLQEYIEDFNPFVIFCVRNPIDVWASIVHAQFSRHSSVHTMFHYHTILDAANELRTFCCAFNRYMDVATDTLKYSKCNLIFYETFLAQTFDCIRSLSAAVGFSIREEQSESVLVRHENYSPGRNKPSGEQNTIGPGRWWNEVPFSIAEVIWIETSQRYLSLIDQATHGIATRKIRECFD